MNTLCRLLLSALFVAPVLTSASDPFAEKRERLVRQIEAEARATAADTGRARFNDVVIRALSRVPRHRFVPADLVDAAYLDHPLPIGWGRRSRSRTSWR